MGKESQLNRSIDLEIVNKYLNQNDMPQISSKRKYFEIVGIVTKSNHYYKALNGFELKAFTYSTNREDIVPKEFIKHMGTIYLNTENINSSKIKLGCQVKI